MHLDTNHFVGQHEHENIKLLLRRHILVLIWNLVPPVVLGVIIITANIFLPLVFPNLSESAIRDFFPLAINVFSLFAIGLTFLIFMDWYLDVWILTNERIVDIEQKGLFNRHVSEFEFFRIQDVTVEAKGVFATLFNFGNIRIQTAGERVEFIFSQVSSPYSVKDRILKEAKEAIPINHGNINVR